MEEETLIELPGIEKNNNSSLSSNKKKRERGNEEDDVVLEPLQKQPKIIIDKEEAEERRRLMYQIRLYEKTFDFVSLERYDIDSLDNKELESVLNDIRFQVSNQNSMNFSKNLLGIGCQVTESVCCTFSPIRAEGFASMMLQDPSVDSTLKEIFIEMQSLQYIPPANRLLYLSAMNLLSCHQMNRAKSNIEQELETDIEDPFEEL